MPSAPAGRRFFPLQQRAQAIAIACELPAKLGLPLSRLSCDEVVRVMEEEGIVLSIGRSTVHRWFQERALRPWRHRMWIFPRDPKFVQRMVPVLDLYERRLDGRDLKADEYVISADEKTSIQVLRRIHEPTAPYPGQVGRYEFEYRRHGVWAYLAGLDVHSGQVLGRVEAKTGKEPFMRLVDDTMRREPYREARRVFWIVDNGSSHHRNTFAERLKARYPRAVAVHLPNHASWLNQVEIYFSILERKALTPNDISDRDAARERILGFEARHNQVAKPFKWNFTRADLRQELIAVN
jgi:DDE superfamily endonuclease